MKGKICAFFKQKNKKSEIGGETRTVFSFMPKYLGLSFFCPIETGNLYERKMAGIFRKRLLRDQFLFLTCDLCQDLSQFWQGHPDLHRVLQQTKYICSVNSLSIVRQNRKRNLVWENIMEASWMDARVCASHVKFHAHVQSDTALFTVS